MKHVKLFEQYDDPFGEEIHNNEFEFLMWKTTKKIYIKENIINGYLILYNNYHFEDKNWDRFFNTIEKSEIGEKPIFIYDLGWKEVQYKNLPQEIKNKLR